MEIIFTPQFINDLKDFDDAHFAKRVLGQIFDNSGNFKVGQNDHRYDGLEGAWIRYASSGSNAYRIIYIKKKDKIYLYRAGGKKVEDRLKEPKELSTNIVVENYTVASKKSTTPSTDFGVLLKNSDPIYLCNIIQSMFHVAHHEISLISPYYSESIFSQNHAFGGFLDKSIEEGAAVCFITLPPCNDKSLKFFENLEARGMLVYFFEKLHAKLYLFDINTKSLNSFNKSDYKRTAVLGSANITESGFSFNKQTYNEELCYLVPQYQFDELSQYVTWILNHSTDYVSHKNRQRRF